jgi:hypothetical protein
VGPVFIVQKRERGEGAAQGGSPRFGRGEHDYYDAALSRPAAHRAPPAPSRPLACDRRP